ncbi:MAG: carbohydrate-binding domain-containing protein [Eubacterium sp.]|nr:carbohydrate-binding domain-containing protein [Eubacterium sp.]
MKKTISFICAFVMLLSVFTGAIPTFAVGHSIRKEALVVGSESMSNESEGWSYDAKTNTLVLNNVTIDCSGEESDGNCITATEELNLVLEGENTLISKTEYQPNGRMKPVFYYGPSLTVSGTGILNINEGNYSFDSNKSDDPFVINGGTININHNFENREFDETSTALIYANLNLNTVINDGEINSDTAFSFTEINGGKVNVNNIISKNDLVINDGEVNAELIAVTANLTVNGGNVNTTGGFIQLLVKDYYSEHRDQNGILSVGKFVLNGGDVYTYGSSTALSSFDMCINGGSFVAESENAAVLVVSGLYPGFYDGDSDINIAKTVKIEEPSSYEILSFDYNSSSETQDIKYKLIFDSATENPYFEGEEENGDISTNAAKRVVVKEYYDYSIAADVESLDFGSFCFEEDYSNPETITITNTGNRDAYITIAATDVGAFNVASVSGNKMISPGNSAEFTVTPKQRLSFPHDFSFNIEFVSKASKTSDVINSVTIPVSIKITSHDFGEFISNNDATYDSDGTKSRTCSLCGGVQTVRDNGSKLKRNGWFEEESGWRYYINNKAQTGWINDEGYWFYLDEEGVMQTGWINDGGYWFYLNSHGVMMTGWVKDNGYWYYLNSHGVMMTGWVKDNGYWYYLNSHGAMMTGWVKDRGYWYYLNFHGDMKIGWLKYNNKWYYLNSTGDMRTKNLLYKGKTYRFSSSGYCLNP